MKQQLDKKTTRIRIVFIVLFLVIMTILAVALIPMIRMLITEEGRLEIERMISDHKTMGVFIFLAIQILQVIVVLVPGEPVELIAGVLFGPLGGLALCLIGGLIGTIVVFYLVKALGYPIVNSLFGKKDIRQLSILKDAKKLETLVFILFLIPGTPKSALTYIIPLTEMRSRTFFTYATLARIPSVISSTAVGASIGNGNWTMSVVIFIITAAIGLVGILYKDTIISQVRDKKNDENSKKD